MKKYKYLLLFLTALGIHSCAENELPQIDDVNGPTLAQFVTTTTVLATPEEGASTEIEVVVNTISNEDRLIEISVDPESTALATQYEVSDLVIPAGSYFGNISISSNYAALPESGSSYLILNLEGIGNSEAVIESGTLSVEMFRTCPIVLEELVGTWSGTTAWDYDSEVVTFLNEEGDLMINGLTFGWFQDWWGEVIVTNEAVKLEVNLATGEISIPEQFYITSTYLGDPQPSYSIKATGMILNPCERTMEIRPVLVQGGAAIDGSAYGPAFKEVIKLQ